ncbi:MAG: oligopeptide:H+ symporter [Caulobacter sp.]|nr:oligopeptide:H+ symporter [Caulobacter sp.]
MNIVIALGILVTLATGIPVLLQMRAHPKGLFILFFAEMWERFSYYGMRGILIFYLTQHFLFSDQFSGGIYGSYTSLVYLLPLLGGILADRFLGTRKAIAFGALLLVAGHGMMAVEGRPAQQTLNYQGAAYEMQVEGRGSARDVKIKVGDSAYSFSAGDGGALMIKDLPAASPLPATLPRGSYEMKETRDPVYTGIFFLALSLIIMGVGFLKPNISTIVGQLYPQGDPRRDPGFTLYYYGINMGAFWASVLCGYLGQTVGWWAGFGLAGVGMLAGYIVFVLGKPLLEGHGEPPNPEKLATRVVGPVNREGLIYILGILGVGLVWFMVQRNSLVGTVLIASTALSIAFIGWFMIFKCDKVQRERMAMAMVLIFGAVVFFTLFEQAGTSLNLFADRNVDLSLIGAPMTVDVLGQSFYLATREMMAASVQPAGAIWIDMSVTAAQTQSFNAAFILIFAPIFAGLWLWLGKHKRDPDPVMKFGLGLIQVGLGFMVLVWGAGMADSAYQMPLMMLGMLYLLHTTGELFLSPVGLSEITKLSVASIVSFMMAVWFLSSSIAQFVGGWIAGLAGTETVGGQVLDPAGALATSLGIFSKLGWAGIGVGVFFILISFFIKHWAHGVTDASEHPAPEIDGDRQSMPH